MENDPNESREDSDDSLPSTVTFLTNPSGAQVYLLGTGHFSVKSQQDVSKVIRKVKPHIVVVELCKGRASVMQMDEETILKEVKDFSLDNLRGIVRDNGFLQGILYFLLLNLSANLTKEHGIAPGGEFRRALAEVQSLEHCLLCYGDRPLRITIKRALSRLSWFQSIYLFFSLLLSSTDKITAEEIEKYKEKDIIEEMIANLLKDYPDLSHVLISERDIVLTYALQNAAEKRFLDESGHHIPARVVGIVGIGHCSGITKLWGTVTDDQIPPLMQIPEPRKRDIVVKFVLKTSFFCFLAWGVLRLSVVRRPVDYLSAAFISKINHYSK